MEKEILLKLVEDEPSEWLHKGILADFLEGDGDKEAALWRSLSVLQQTRLFPYALGQTVYCKDGQKKVIRGMEIYVNRKGQILHMYKIDGVYGRNRAVNILRPSSILAGRFEDLKHRYKVGHFVLGKGGLVVKIVELGGIAETKGTFTISYSGELKDERPYTFDECTVKRKTKSW